MDTWLIIKEARRLLLCIAFLEHRLGFAFAELELADGQTGCKPWLSDAFGVHLSSCAISLESGLNADPGG